MQFYSDIAKPFVARDHGVIGTLVAMSHTVLPDPEFAETMVNFLPPAQRLDWSGAGFKVVWRR